MTTTETHGHKTFPRQPKWNSGGALGSLTGLVFGLLVPLDNYGVHWVIAEHYASATNVFLFGIVGMCAGMVIGAMADRGESREKRLSL